MSTSGDWELLGVIPDGQRLLIGGLDVWKHEWKATNERIHIKDPLYHQDFTFRVCQISSAGRVVTFAAGEFSNCMWGFYVQR